MTPNEAAPKDLGSAEKTDLDNWRSAGSADPHHGATVLGQGQDARGQGDRRETPSASTISPGTASVRGPTVAPRRWRVHARR
jgi:hypothetical protein